MEPRDSRDHNRPGGSGRLSVAALRRLRACNQSCSGVVRQDMATTAARPVSRAAWRLVALLGAALGLLATGNPFGFTAFMGLVGLGGVVVRNAIILIGGPRSYNWNEIVTAVGNLLGQPLPVNYVNPFETVPLLPPGMSILLSVMESQDSYTIDMSKTSQVYGVEPTSLESFAQRMFGSAS